MPELPEVETTARGLRARLLGLQVNTVHGVDWPRMLPNVTESDLSRTITGQTVEAVERRGKYLLLRFSNNSVVAFHRKMSGNLLLQSATTPAPRHTHLVVAFIDSLDLRFVDPRKFGRVYLFPDDAAFNVFAAARIGPEPLDDLDGSRLVEQLRGRRGRVKSLLLDQRFLAGVGNLYADEALWKARIHPFRTADSLSEAEAYELAAALREILLDAIARRGTSLSDYRDADGEQGEYQSFLRVYGRGPSHGRPGACCPTCDTPFERLLLGQRSSTFCPTCQPRVGPVSSNR